MFQNMTATSYYENCKLKKVLERQKLEKVCICCLEQGLVKIVKKMNTMTLLVVVYDIKLLKDKIGVI